MYIPPFEVLKLLEILSEINNLSVLLPPLAFHPQKPTAVSSHHSPAEVSVFCTGCREMAMVSMVYVTPLKWLNKLDFPKHGSAKGALLF